jgi:hypothetical protein
LGVEHALLQIFASLPVSTTTHERTFSAMKNFKTYLRSRLTDEKNARFGNGVNPQRYQHRHWQSYLQLALKNGQLKLNQ